MDRGIQDGGAYDNTQPYRRWAIDIPVGPPEGHRQGLQREEAVRGRELTESYVV